MQCPKCKFQQADERSECMSCGVIFAKFKSASYAQASSSHSSQGDTPAIHAKSASYKNYEFNLATFGEKIFSVNESFVMLKNKRLPSSEIQWMKFGTQTIYVNLIKAGSSHLVELGTSTDKIKFELGDALYFKNGRKLYEEILDALWECVGSRIVSDIIRYIEMGRSYQIGNSVWERQGVRLPRGGIFSRKEYVLVGYGDLELYFGNGTVCLRSGTDHKAKTSAELRRVENACLIRMLFELMVMQGYYRSFAQR